MSRVGDGRPPDEAEARDERAEDMRLMVALAGGDRAALAALYDRYAPLLLGMVLPMLGNRREAEDLVHDVFIEVWRHAGDYDAGRGSVRTWITLRARSRALDRLRSVAHTRVDPIDEAVVDRQQHPVEDRPFAADCARVRATLTELPEEQRTCLILAYYEGLTSQEIAVRIGAKVGTVKSRVAAGLGKLRAALAPTRGES